MEMLFSTPDSTLMTLVFVLSLVTVGTLWLVTRKPKPEHKLQVFSSPSIPLAPAEPELAMAVPGKTAVVMKLDKFGDVTDQPLHPVEIFGFVGNDKVVVRKPNGVYVKRAARRVLAVNS